MGPTTLEVLEVIRHCRFSLRRQEERFETTIKKRERENRRENRRQTEIGRGWIRIFNN